MFYVCTHTHTHTHTHSSLALKERQFPAKRVC